ncbi:MAG TPA: PTS system mannose/fructose/sorbose family transporter subunit IID [Firmicutes bacterium]|nr:PTS system mannose/fructose/sorbose family transporter subunit IID [Candidatus Fermentithermobacillaceae bacterium]
MASGVQVTKKSGPKTTKDTWWTQFWRSQFIYAWFSFDKMEAMGALYMLYPFMKEHYKTKEEMIAACQNHVQFFNTQPYVANFIIGICIAMIETGQSQEAINAIKVGLMGPLAGIGDSLLWFTIRPILFSVGAGMALQGNVLGPIFAFAAFFFVHWIVRYHGERIGYEQGTKFIERFAESGMMDEVTLAISMVGITVVGCLIATWVSASTPLVLKAGEGEGMAFQPVLDMLMPKLLPALATFLAFWLLVKKRVNPMIVIFIFMLLGILGSVAGVLA